MTSNCQQESEILGAGQLETQNWEYDKKIEFQKENKNVDEELVRGTRSLFDIYQRCNISIMEPARCEEAATNKKWISAMEEKLKMIEKNQTWELVDKPNHKKAIGVNWVYKTKLNPNGSINKYKARLVVKGYAQIFGVDFSKTFVAQNGWAIHQMDVKSIFLYGYNQKVLLSQDKKRKCID